ncbi:spastin [Anaeramoeba flamelloides]|uniref:microtubule-severing ATPase n=1 Tax=Anaeramoeba flamelloides TaxID=1746091 RepID=A0AAV7ZE10_9EUKA|nr:spastin [Anaeramoeba flamelloides]
MSTGFYEQIVESLKEFLNIKKKEQQEDPYLTPHHTETNKQILIVTILFILFLFLFLIVMIVYKKFSKKSPSLKTSPLKRKKKKPMGPQKNSSSFSNNSSLSNNSSQGISQLKIKKFNRLVTKALAHTNKATDLDEKKQSTEALSEYLLAISCINTACKMNFTKYEYHLIQQKRSKIVLIKNKANERIKLLGKRKNSTTMNKKVEKTLSNKNNTTRNSTVNRGRFGYRKTSSITKIKNTRAPRTLKLKPRSKTSTTRQTKRALNTRKTTLQKTNSRTNNTNSTEKKTNKTEKKKNKNEKKTNLNQKLIEQIELEIVDNKSPVSFDEIAGLEQAKDALHETIILPNLRPELFTGLRTPAKGILLFGPPGTGKTMIARATASTSNCTFFSISASSLTSKFVGEGEKLVKSLFYVARERQPSIIFIDEIDSLLQKRGGSNELESSRRIKTEFLVQLEGATSPSEERILIIAGTNRPHDLDEAVLRRFVKKIYIPPPDYNARKFLIEILLKKQQNDLTNNQIEKVAKATNCYSGADITNLTKEAAMCAIRELGKRVETISKSKIRPLSYKDFLKALKIIKPSITKQGLSELEKWNRNYGCY